MAERPLVSLEFRISSKVPNKIRKVQYFISGKKPWAVHSDDISRFKLSVQKYSFFTRRKQALLAAGRNLSSLRLWRKSDEAKVFYLIRMDEEFYFPLNMHEVIFFQLGELVALIFQIKQGGRVFT